MRKVIYGIITAIVLVFGIVLFTNNNTDNHQKQNIVSFVEEIKNSNGQLIDVREPSEYQTSHADGAINIPLGDIVNKDFSKIDTKRPIYLICKSGNRAGQAKIILEQSGYKNVKSIGGLVDWENQGAKVCSSLTPICE